jgi:hypothetical protein
MLQFSVKMDTTQLIRRIKTIEKNVEDKPVDAFLLEMGNYTAMLMKRKLRSVNYTMAMYWSIRPVVTGKNNVSIQAVNYAFDFEQGTKKTIPTTPALKKWANQRIREGIRNDMTGTYPTMKVDYSYSTAYNFMTRSYEQARSRYPSIIHAGVEKITRGV